MTYFCGACKKECTPKATNEGIGQYEYWGAPGHDNVFTLASDCCENKVYEDEECTELSEYGSWPQNEIDQRADYEYDQAVDKLLDER